MIDQFHNYNITGGQGLSRMPCKRSHWSNLVKVSKNLAKYESETILLDYQNNYIEYLNWLLEYLY